MYCKKINHNINNSWKLQLTNQKKKNKAGGDCKDAIISSGNFDGECLVVFATCVSRDDESFHICCIKD
jgi:hypothetical protein